MNNVLSIAIVSHGHSQLIIDNPFLDNIANDSFFSVCIVDNLGEDQLSQWAGVNKVGYLRNLRMCGFGHNNNQAFSWFESLGKLGEFFLVLNPDVVVDSSSLKKLIAEMVAADDYLATINLYRDNNKSIYDNSIRRFPTFSDFFLSFAIGKNNSVLNKRLIESPIFVDWAAGSFLVFKSDHFLDLNGFDERYFMYCEDIDICKRSFEYNNARVRYYPSISAVHFAAHGNRKLFSKHFFWHMKSVFMYLSSAYKYSFQRFFQR